MKDVTSRLFLFSVFNSTDKATNDARHDNLLASLLGNNRNALEVSGKFNGVVERSIALHGDNNFEEVVSDICHTHKQECYLVVYHDMVAELVYNNGNRKVIGEFTKVDKDTALASESYTNLGDIYYVVK